jgi:hypothetical protein
MLIIFLYSVSPIWSSIKAVNLKNKSAASVLIKSLQKLLDILLEISGRNQPISGIFNPNE